MFTSEKQEPHASIHIGIAYSPLVEYGITNIRHRHERPLLLYLILEATLLLGAFAAYISLASTPLACTSGPDPASYSSLASYNKTNFFTENNDMMRETSEAEHFWMTLLQTDGVVSVPTQWALDAGFTTSLENPERPGESVYQVDMYHSLHCLDHIRRRLVSKVPLSKWPRDDNHSLHCVNYIRQQIMCHADVTLGGTDDVLHYGLNNGNQCRDYEAVVDWTHRHQWKGHVGWIERVYGFTAGAGR